MPTLALAAPLILRSLQRRCKVHVIEVGYCTESFRRRKQQQHVALCTHLRTAGWSLTTPLGRTAGYPDFLLGTDTIFLPCDALLRSRGVSSSSALGLRSIYTPS